MSSTDSEYLSLSEYQTRSSKDLISASSLGDLVLVENMLKSKLHDIDGINSSGWTALMYASHYGHFNVVRILIQNDCYVDYQDEKGRTALMMAASNGHTRCMEMLINFGKADKTIRDCNDHDAVYYAKTCGHGNNKMIKAILGTTEVKGRNMWSAPESGSSSPLRKKPALLKKMIEEPNAYESSVFSNTSKPYWLPPKYFSAAETVQEESSTIVSTKMPPQLPNTSNESLSPTSSYSAYSYSKSFIPQLSVPEKENWKKGRKPIIGRKNSRQKYYLPQHLQSSPPLPLTLNDLLSRIGLQQYLNLFETNGIDLFSFLILNEEDLRGIGITLLPHLKQLTIAQLRYHESSEIRSNQSMFTDWLLNEREMHLRKILELEDKIKFFEYQQN